MGELGLLRELVVISAAALLVVGLLQRVGVPFIAGFIVAGALIGPHGLALIGDVHQIELLAELGVVLLLFGIGLELSLERIRRLWRAVLFGGTLQVALTTGGTFAVAFALGLPWGGALFLGFMVAVSSTAIVLRALGDRGELEAPHGRLTLGILIYQDLCVVPMMLAVPLLAGEGGGWEVAVPLLRAFAVLGGVVLAARVIVPRALHLVALTRQRNLFVLAVFLICLGTAWIAASAGVSLALGAFLAGLVVSGSEYRTQALSDLIPIREVLTSVFFVSVGMLLDPVLLATRLLPIVGLLVAIVAGKFLLVLITGRLLRLPLRPAVLSAGALAQIGEFSFILARAAEGHALLSEGLLLDLTAATILSMLITPLMLAAAPHLAAGAGRIRALTRLLEVRSVEESAGRLEGLRDHVIIAGFGVAGQELANTLRHCDVPYVVLEMNTETVRRANAAGQPAYFGDVTSPDVLEHLGAAHARELVLVINDPSAVVRAVTAARRAAPHLHIVVRSRFLLDVQPVYAAGADMVVPAELEAAVKVADYVLRRHEIPDPDRQEQLSRIRARREEEPG